MTLLDSGKYALVYGYGIGDSCGMPIRPALKNLYPLDWKAISARVRFERAGGVCEMCGRPHGLEVRVIADGRWYDGVAGWWRDGAGMWIETPTGTVRESLTRVVLAAAHRDHDPGNCADANLMALCQRCHMIHDREHHMTQRRITYGLRRAMGDLFDGPYVHG